MYIKVYARVQQGQGKIALITKKERVESVFKKSVQHTKKCK